MMPSPPPQQSSWAAALLPSSPPPPPPHQCSCEKSMTCPAVHSSPPTSPHHHTIAAFNVFLHSQPNLPLHAKSPKDFTTCPELVSEPPTKLQNLQERDKDFLLDLLGLCLHRLVIRRSTMAIWEEFCCECNSLINVTY